MAEMTLTMIEVSKCKWARFEKQWQFMVGFSRNKLVLIALQDNA